MNKFAKITNKYSNLILIIPFWLNIQKIKFGLHRVVFFEQYVNINLFKN